MYFGMSPGVEEPPMQFQTKLSKDWLHNEIYAHKSRQIQDNYKRRLNIFDESTPHGKPNSLKAPLE
jgi:hypothetical protein